MRSESKTPKESPGSATKLTSMKDIYIAGPLFNTQQVSILETIEDLAEQFKLSYYSPRIHSGSSNMTAEDRKSFEAWDKVFKSNEEELRDCRMLICVLNYALPTTHKLVMKVEHTDIPVDPKADITVNVKEFPIELPDSGTVWEMGYYRACMRPLPVIGYHDDEVPKSLNLMLSHGCDYLVCGSAELSQFLEVYTDPDLKAEHLAHFQPRNRFGGRII